MLHNEDAVYEKDYARNQTADARYERRRKGLEGRLITKKEIDATLKDFKINTTGIMEVTEI